MSSTAKRLQGERGPGGPQGLWAQCKGPDRQSSGLCWLDLTPGNAFQRPCDRKNKRSIITYPLLLPSCGSLRGQQVKHLRPKGVRAGVGWAMTTSVPLEGSIAQTQSRTPFSIALRIHGGAPSSEGLRVLPGWQVECPHHRPGRPAGHQAHAACTITASWGTRDSAVLELAHLCLLSSSVFKR